MGTCQVARRPGMMSSGAVACVATEPMLSEGFESAECLCCGGQAIHPNGVRQNSPGSATKERHPGYMQANRSTLKGCHTSGETLRASPASRYALSYHGAQSRRGVPPRQDGPGRSVYVEGRPRLPFAICYSQSLFAGPPFVAAKGRAKLFRTAHQFHIAKIAKCDHAVAIDEPPDRFSRGMSNNPGVASLVVTNGSAQKCSGPTTASSPSWLWCGPSRLRSVP